MEDYSIIIAEICSNIPNETTEIANFLFAHYMSIETLSCQSNESSWILTVKNITFVEGNVISMNAKFQLHPTYGF